MTSRACQAVPALLLWPLRHISRSCPLARRAVRQASAAEWRLVGSSPALALPASPALAALPVEPFYIAPRQRVSVAIHSSHPLGVSVGLPALEALRAEGAARKVRAPRRAAHTLRLNRPAEPACSVCRRRAATPETRDWRGAGGRTGPLSRSRRAAGGLLVVDDAAGSLERFLGDAAGSGLAQARRRGGVAGGAPSRPPTSRHAPPTQPPPACQCGKNCMD